MVVSFFYVIFVVEIKTNTVMTQEQTDLLFKDLCGRLPYGVKVQTGDTPVKTINGLALPRWK